MHVPAFDKPAPIETPGDPGAAIPTRDYRKYLDPKTLAKISSLDLRARLVVEGYISGMHRSPYRGFSIEFAEHRQYTQGDDTRHIDWKVFARTNKYYIKQYEEETNLVCVIAVDCSESMTYKSPQAPMSKHDYAISLAASLTYLALRQQDAVGLAIFDESVTRFIRPNSHPAHWKTVIHELEGSTGPSKTSLGVVLDELAERLKQRTLVILISDCLNDPEEIRKGLKHLRYRRNEIILCHVLDPAELSFPFRGPTKFKGLEVNGHLLCEPRALRERYVQEVQHFISNLRKMCRSLHLDYELYNTQDPLDVALGTYLATRSAGMRWLASMNVLFTNPLFAWMAAGLIAVPILIHLLNRRRHREVPWAAMMFLLAANRKSVRRMRLEQWLLLALRTATIVLLPLAMARPLLHSALASGLLTDDRHHLLILDPSLSMSAPTARGGPSVFDHQLERAGELIDNLPEGDPITLISAGFPARRLNRQPLRSKTRVRQVLGTLQAQATHSDLAGAFVLAEDTIDAGRGDREDISIHVFGDFTPAVLEGVPQATPAADAPPMLADKARNLAERARIALYQVGGKTPPNLAIHELRLGSPLVGTRRLTEVIVSLRNYAASRSAPATIELLVDGRPSAELNVAPLDPGATEDVESAIEFDTVGQHAVEARLTTAAGNALQADDRRRLVVRAREHIPVLIVDGKPGPAALDGQAGYVATALAPRTQVSESTFIESTVVPENELAGAALDRFAVVILCNVRRLPEGRWAEVHRYVREGHGLIVFLGDLVDDAHYNHHAGDLLPGTLQGPAFRTLSDDDFVRFSPERVGPALSAVFGGRKSSGAFQARIHQYDRMGAADQLTTGVALLSYDNGDIAIAEREVGQGRTLVCTTTANMDWTNLPAKGDFVTLCMSLLHRVAPQSAPHRNLGAGSELIIQTDGAAATAAEAGRLRTPGGRVLVPEVRASTRGLALNFGRLSDAGWYSLESIRDEGPVAVNGHPAESDLRRLDPSEIRERLDCDYAWLEVAPGGRSIVPGEAGGANSAMLFGVLMLLLCESVAAMAFGHHKR